jgi:thiosulfate/3-mercaptopyruvate sulfurtransferase
VVTFCNTGVLAATNWFALSEVLGIEGVRLYPGGMSEWTTDPSLPMDNVPDAIAGSSRASSPSATR